jgi:ABC-type Fe3+ transport system permease subunit
LILLAAQGITWVKVEAPRLDVVGLILGSLGFAGAAALGALLLGVVLGLARIRRSRRSPDGLWNEHGLLGLTRP